MKGKFHEWGGRECGLLALFCLTKIRLSMKVSCLFVPEAVTTPLSRALMARCFFSSCSFSIVDYRLEIEVASWEAFLPLVWGAFAAVSRGSWPAAMACEWHFLVGCPSVPVWVRYDPICGGLRYGRCAMA